MELELVKIKAEEFEEVFLIYKIGLLSHLDKLFGWNEQDQRRRLESNYGWDWFNKKLIRDGDLLL